MILPLAKTKWVVFLVFLIYFHIGENSQMTYPCSELRAAADGAVESLLQAGWVAAPRSPPLLAHALPVRNVIPSRHGKGHIAT